MLANQSFEIVAKLKIWKQLQQIKIFFTNKLNAEYLQPSSSESVVFPAAT